MRGWVGCGDEQDAWYRLVGMDGTVGGEGVAGVGVKEAGTPHQFDLEPSQCVVKPRCDSEAGHVPREHGQLLVVASEQVGGVGCWQKDLRTMVAGFGEHPDEDGQGSVGCAGPGEPEVQPGERQAYLMLVMRSYGELHRSGDVRCRGHGRVRP